MTAMRLQRGFTVLEILIAVFVLSVGVLGLAQLQVQTLRYSASSSQRTNATYLAYDLADRMRANMAGVNFGNYHLTQAESVSGCMGAAQTCYPWEMASNDVYLWRISVANLLPDGQGLACIDSTPADGTFADPECDNVAGAQYAVKLWWRDGRTPDAQRFVTSFVP